VLRYAGYLYDDYSGLYYLQRRYYDPVTRSFLTRDPAQADGLESPWQYCQGRPVSIVDPTGLAGHNRGGAAIDPHRLADLYPTYVRVGGGTTEPLNIAHDLGLDDAGRRVDSLFNSALVLAKDTYLYDRRNPKVFVASLGAGMVAGGVGYAAWDVLVPAAGAYLARNPDAADKATKMLDVAQKYLEGKGPSGVNGPLLDRLNASQKVLGHVNANHVPGGYLADVRYKSLFGFWHAPGSTEAPFLGGSYSQRRRQCRMARPSKYPPSCVTRPLHP
jgi:RHS repeat-associated protein